MQNPIVDAQGLKKTFDDVQAVQGVSFKIAAGEAYSLLGPNGAGKTTTISMLTGLLSPDSGDAAVDGHSVVSQTRSVKQAIGVVPQEIALYPTITARENLAFWGKMYGLRGSQLKDRVADVLDIAGLTDRADDKVDTYSGGMKRRINIAVGLLNEPKIIFMDEPTVGIDPQSRRRILDTVKALNERGMAVLYTTHYMEEAEELSHRIGIIDHGQLIAEGTLGELTRTVGENDTIRLDVDAGQASLDSCVKLLAALPLVSHAAAEDQHLILQTQDTRALLPEALSTLADNGARVHALEIQEPNLEAVFLHLTGRALRD
jgi:ABC-2 type transport system ATP-binding protein